MDRRYSGCVKTLRPLLLDQTPEEWGLLLQPAYRRKQIAEWIYAKRAASIDEMTKLPASMRQHLADA